MTTITGPLDAIRTLASPIRFSITNEDHRIIEQALAPRPDACVVTIASAGDTPLECLRIGAAKVHAVDVSASQIHLCALKAAGIRELSHDDFLTLLGIVRDPDRASLLYDRVRDALHDESRRFWDRHRHLITRGVIAQGRMIGFFALLLKILGSVAGAQAIDDLASIRSPEEGRRFVDTLLSKPQVWIALRSAVGLLLVAHRGRALSAGLPSRRRVSAMLTGALGRLPVAENPYVFPFLFGRYPSLEHVPPHLGAAGYAQTRRRVGRLQLHCRPISEFLATLAEGSVDGFELSNVVDWQRKRETLELLEQVVRAGRPGAPVLLFSRNQSPTIPPELDHDLEDDPTEGQRLLALDRSGFYRAIVRWRIRPQENSR